VVQLRLWWLWSIDHSKSLVTDHGAGGRWGGWSIVAIDRERHGNVWNIAGRSASVVGSGIGYGAEFAAFATDHQRLRRNLCWSTAFGIEYRWEWKCGRSGSGLECTVGTL